MLPHLVFGSSPSYGFIRRCNHRQQSRPQSHHSRYESLTSIVAACDNLCYGQTLAQLCQIPFGPFGRRSGLAESYQRRLMRLRDDLEDMGGRWEPFGFSLLWPSPAARVSAAAWECAEDPPVALLARSGQEISATVTTFALADMAPHEQAEIANSSLSSPALHRPALN